MFGGFSQKGVARAMSALGGGAASRAASRATGAIEDLGRYAAHSQLASGAASVTRSSLEEIGRYSAYGAAARMGGGLRNIRAGTSARPPLMGSTPYVTGGPTASAASAATGTAGRMGKYMDKAKGFFGSMPSTFWGHAARGAAMGGVTGGISGFVNGGFGGAMGGALSGALWGGGLSAGMGMAGGRAKGGLATRGNASEVWKVTSNRVGQEMWRGHAGLGVGGSVSFAKNLPQMKAMGAYISPRQAGMGFATKRGSFYFNAKLSTIGGVAGGLIGGAGQGKSHSTLAANGWGMGPATPGAFY